MHHSGQESVRVIDGVEEILAERGGFFSQILHTPRKPWFISVFTLVPLFNF